MPLSRPLLPTPRAKSKPNPGLRNRPTRNLAANRIADLDRRHVPWKQFREINFVNIDYKPFDASGWPAMASGLLGPVRLLVPATPPATGP
ncbi:MAG: hypothetical protein WCK77_03640 [Verrucomicrobiota bacterium]